MTDSFYPNRVLASKILACAFCEVFPEAQIVSGGATDIGFYYDFLLEQPLDENGLALVETAFKTIAKEKRPVQIKEMMRENGADYLRHHKQPIAAAILELNPHNIISVIGIGNFFDSLNDKIAIPPTTEECGAIKILEATPKTEFFVEFEDLSLVRIEGVSFPTRDELKQFLKKYHQFKKLNHLLLFEELNLALPQEESFTWLPAGLMFKEQLSKLWKKAIDFKGYQLIKTPPIVGSIANHSLVIEIDGHPYATFSHLADRHAHFFSAKERQAAELPLRYAEWGERVSLLPEKNLYGMINARSFETDCLSAFCTEEQVGRELISSLQFFDKIIKIIGFECQWILVSSRDPYSLSTLAKWNQAVSRLTDAAKALGLSWGQDQLKEVIDGPRLELRLSDPLGRKWTGPAVCIDLHRPIKQKLKYKAANGRKEAPVLLRQALFGSFERLTALLLEQREGCLPLWLASEQVRILPVGQKQKKWAEAFLLQLEKGGIRATLDQSEKKLGSKVCAAEKEKIPYLAIVGDREEKEGVVALRSSRKNELQIRIKPDKFLEQLQSEIKNELAPLEEIFRASSFKEES